METVQSVKQNGTPKKRRLTPLHVKPSASTRSPEQHPQHPQNPERHQPPPDEESRKLPWLLKLVYLENNLLLLPIFVLANHAKIIEQAYRWELMLHEFLRTFLGGRVSDDDAAARNAMCGECPVGYTHEDKRYCMGCT